MTAQSAGVPAPRKPLRLWPGVVLVALQWLIRFAVPLALPEALVVGILGGLFGGLAIVVWWAFFSRARWTERLGAVLLMAVGLIATRPLLHESIATGGQGMMYFLLAIPVLSLAFVAWAVATRRLPDGLRWATMAATVLLACGGWALIKTGGVGGDFDNDLSWRWSPTPEERLLAQLGTAPPTVPAGPAVAEPSAEPPASTPATKPVSAEPAAVDEEPIPEPRPAAPAVAEAAAPSEAASAAPDEAAVVAETAASWPGFRGPARHGAVRGVRIATDWAASPPVELWRRPVGPGWSSFAVRDGLVYTQEQRGDDEVVACYRADSGEPVWIHGDPVRFWESNAGAGPRATPTLHDGRVVTLGATGIVNVLDAATGAVVWSRNAVDDTEAKIPTWGISGSPLVVGDLVVVAASGSLVAYDLTTGERRWSGPTGGASYCSPQMATITGVPQILLLRGPGLASVAPADGALLWEHEWKGYPIVQPAQTAEGDVLIAANESSGVRRLAVAQGPGGWTVEERWTSIGLKPYFNDFVVHEGHAYGFDGRILSAIDLADGTRKWKGGRYGSGQLVLLPEQDLLLVLSEQGELALVAATPDGYRELAKVPGITGKTWNHPVVAGDVLYVRNAEEMAAFRLAKGG